MDKIQLIKNHINIIDLVENYTELKANGNRYRAKTNPLREGGDLDIFNDTQKFYDWGTGEGGDIVDFIKIVENLDTKEAIIFLHDKYLNGIDIKSSYINPQPKPKPVKNNLLLSETLTARANKYLTSIHPKYKHKWGMTTININGIEKNVVRIAPYLEKLFEGNFIATDEKFAKYIFNKIIGYDSYFNCPVIIIRDQNEQVIDIVRYRPIREGFSDLPKYLYTKGSDKPDSDYIFPLQTQMQRMLLDQKYCFIGEGLKNAINASMMGVPFISIEGASNIKQSLISFLKKPRMNNILMVGAFDGDVAGEKAYKKINAEIPMQNKFDFNSGMDFAEYLKELGND